MPVNQFVYGIKLIGDASGGVSAINTLKNALGGLQPAAEATSRTLRALSSAKGVSAPIDQANLNQARLSKRKWGLDDSEERLRVAQKKLRDAGAEEGYADMDRMTAPSGANTAQLDKAYEDAKQKRMTAERYVYNAEVNLARKTSEYRLSLFRNEISERQKLTKMEAQTEQSVDKAAAGRADVGLGQGTSEGRDMAANTKQMVDQLDQSVLQISDKVKQALPQGWADALQEIATREKASMSQRLQLVVDEADKKKQAMIAAERSVQQATAELQNNPQSEYWRKEVDALMTAYKAAAAASEEADTKAAMVSEQVTQEVADKFIKQEKAKQQAVKQTGQATQDAGKSMMASFNNMKRNFNETVSAGAKLVNSLRLLAQGFQQLAMIVSISVAAPIAAFFKDGMGYAIDFNDQMAKVQKATDLDDSGLSKMEERIRNISNITPIASTDVATFVEQAGQIGVKGVPALTRFMDLMTKLAVGTDVNTATVAEDMGRIAAAFGYALNTEEGMSNLEALASTMDYVAKQTATDMDGIISAMKDAAVVGPMLKIPADQVAAAVGVLISSGVDASAAGTDIQKFFIQVNKNAQKFANAMVGYGDPIRDANGKIIGSTLKYKDAQSVLDALNTKPIEVLKDSLKGLLTATDDQKAQQLKAFYDAAGITGGKVGAMSQNFDKLDEILKGASDEWVRQTTLMGDYNRMLTTTKSQVQVLKNNWHVMGVTIGEAVLPVINQLAQYAVPIIQDISAAFKGLDSQTKLLVVGIPLLVVALAPLLMLLSSLTYAFSLMLSSGLGAIWGLGQGIYALAGGFIKLFSSAKVLGWLAQAFGVTAVAGQKLSLATILTQGSFKTFGKTLTGLFSAINPWIKIPLLIAGSLKILASAGVNVGGFFQKLADRARAWGENLAGTFATGLANGAVKYIAKVVSSIGSFIARFLESHSPPEEGPLSTIDVWGKNLMDTYLKGFLLADFSILSEVSGKIRQAFDILAGLDMMDEKGIPQAMLNVRAAISQLIEGFNRTGEIAEDVLSKIGQGLGDLGPEIQKMVRYWMEYKKLQEQLAALERRKKDTNKVYDEEIKRIAKLNVSAEEKARLMREAMLKRDTELRDIEEEKKATEEQADAAKDKLDWQKEYVDALLENAQLLKDMMDKTKKGSGDEVTNIDRDLSKLDQAGGGSPVNDPGLETNILSQGFKSARSGIDQFKNGWNSKGFGDGMSPEDMAKWQAEDPEGYKNAQNLYDWGVKAKGIWDQVYTAGNKVLNLFGLGDKGSQGGGAAPSNPLIDFLNKVFTTAGNLINMGPGMTQFMTGLDQGFLAIQNALAPLMPYLQPLIDKFKEWVDSVGGPLNAVLTILGYILGFIVALIVGVLVGALNGLGTAFGWIGSIIGSTISAVLEILGGFINFILGTFEFLGGILVGAATGDWTMFSQGVHDILQGLIDIILGFANWIAETAVALIGGAVDTIIQIFGGITVFLLKVFGQEEAAGQVQAWIDSIHTALTTAWTAVSGWFDQVKKDVTSWLTNLFGGASPTLSVNATTNGTPVGHAAGGITKKPHMAMVGEGGESEVIAPLSQLPALFEQMYGNVIANDFAAAGVGASGGGINLYVQNPVIREDSDIDKLADAIEKRLAKKASNSRRLGR